MAAGHNASADGGYSIAVGDCASAADYSSIAIGSDASAKSDSSLALGAYSAASGDSSIASGYYANANGGGAIAAGHNASAQGEASVAVGRNAKAAEAGIAIGADAAAGKNAAAFGKNSNASGTGSTASGNKADASGNYSYAAGYNAGASGYGAAAIANNSRASGTGSTAFGNGAKTSGDYSLAAGMGASASGNYSFAAGYKADSSGKSATALGGMTQAAADYSVAIGRGSVSDRLTTETGVYVPTGSSTTWRNAIKATVKGSYGVVSIGSSDNTRQLTGVAAGIQNTDAVNVAQLKALSARVNTLASSINPKTLADYNESNVTLTGAADAEQDVSGSEWTAVENSSEKLLKLAGEEDAQPTYEKITVTGDGNNIGADMGGNRITNVAAGGVYQGSTDAVNGDQLWNAYRRIDEVQDDAYRAGAHAAALSALHPVAYDPYRPTTISAGLGFYHSKQSVAVGLFHYVKDSVLLNAGVSLNGDGDAMGRVGISFAMGKGGRPAILPVKAEAMQKRIDELEEKNEKLQASNKELKENVDELNSRNERNEAAIKEMAEMIKSLQSKLTK